METDEQYDLLFKVILLGDCGVGKSNLLTRFVHDEFSLETRTTIGIEYACHSFSKHGKRIRAQVWDTAGQERFSSLMSTYYRGAACALVVYDITKQQTFNNVFRWLEELERYGGPSVGTMLVGNKCDLCHLREVPTVSGSKLAEKFGLSFLETSALDATNVRQAFEDVICAQVPQALERAQSAEAEGTFESLPIAPCDEEEEGEASPCVC